MNIVIASFAIVILAIAILFSQRYQFIGSEKGIYKLDTFTGKIEKIEGEVIIKLNKKINAKELNRFKNFPMIENDKAKAFLETEYFNNRVFVKLSLSPKKSFNPKKVILRFFDSNGFLIKELSLTEKIYEKGKILLFGQTEIEPPLYAVITNWQILYQP